MASFWADENLRRSLASVRLLFPGDSITDFWGLAKDPWVTGATGGRSVWVDASGAQPCAA
jgi:hypothetical protein